MKRFDVSKLVFSALCIVGVIGLSITFGLYQGAKRTDLLWFAVDLKNTIKDSLKTVIGEAETIAKVRPSHFLKPPRYEGEGVTVNDSQNEEKFLILLSGFFEDTPEIRLIRREGSIVARWPVSFSAIFGDTSHLQDPPKTDWNVDMQGMIALPDGSIVFNFTNAGLVKLDRCGKVVWKVALTTHHSVVRAEGGGFWVPGNRAYTKEDTPPFPLFETPLSEATALKISEDGRVLVEFSVPQLFFDNGLEMLLTVGPDVTGRRRGSRTEVIHLNKIAELTSDIAADFPMFDAGDLALSMRNLNLVMVVDPDTGKIKWWRIGPWLRQHDPEFKTGGTIVVYNNNQYVNLNDRYVSTDGSISSTSRPSNILEIDPVTDEYKVIFGHKEGQVFSSSSRGSVELMPNGRLFIVEYPWGRVFYTNAGGHVIWEYINRYGPDQVAAITDAAIYPTSYFNVPDWSCAALDD